MEESLLWQEKVVLAGACQNSNQRNGRNFLSKLLPDLGTVVIKEALKRTGIKPEQVDEVIYMGMCHSAVLVRTLQDRRSTQGSGRVPATTIPTYCAAPVCTV